MLHAASQASRNLPSGRNGDSHGNGRSTQHLRLAGKEPTVIQSARVPGLCDQFDISKDRIVSQKF